MNDHFDKALAFVLKNEGGYVNDTNDPGGETKFGISKRFFSSLKEEPLSKKAIKDLTEEDASYIYKRYFWEINKLNFIENKLLAIKLFDFIVNNGSFTSIKILQKTYNILLHPNRIDEDGILGSKTLDNINSLIGTQFLEEFIKEMIKHYEWLIKIYPNNIKFLRGWIERAKRMPDLEAAFCRKE